MDVPAPVRPARPEDAPHLPSIERDAAQLFLTLPDLAHIASGSGLSEDSHRDRITRGLLYVCVDADDGVLGFIALEPQRDELHVVELSVRRSAQRKGFGAALIARACDHARAIGAQALTLTTFREVEWNRPYYEKLGFAVVAQVHPQSHLAATLASEIAHGLAPESRCAMRLRLS